MAGALATCLWRWPPQYPKAFTILLITGIFHPSFAEATTRIAIKKTIVAIAAVTSRVFVQPMPFSSPQTGFSPSGSFTNVILKNYFKVVQRPHPLGMVLTIPEYSQQFIGIFRMATTTL